MIARRLMPKKSSYFNFFMGGTAVPSPSGRPSYDQTAPVSMASSVDEPKNTDSAHVRPRSSRAQPRSARGRIDAPSRLTVDESSSRTARLYCGSELRIVRRPTCRSFQRPKEAFTSFIGKNSRRGLSANGWNP